MKKCKVLVLILLMLTITGSSFISFNRVIYNTGSKFLVATTKHPESGPTTYLNPDNTYLSYLFVYEGEVKNGFAFNTYEYDVIVAPGTKKLKMAYRPEGWYSTAEVIGNENLVNGSKIIIRVTGQNGGFSDYTLTVKYSNSKTIFIILIVVLSLIIVTAITLLVLYMLAQKGIIKFEVKHKENIGVDNYVK